MINSLKEYPIEAVERHRKSKVKELRQLKFTKKQAEWITDNLVDFSFLWK